ncbi:MAG TPA: DUF177 domain-containing protein [Paenirhodobacter sp.]
MSELPLNAPPPWAHPIRIADLGARKPTRFDLKPDAATRAAVAVWAGITAVPALRFRGTLTPRGRSDWVLDAELDARVEQPCVVTLAPVRTELRETVTRRYLADMPVPEGEEVEMPEDDTAEALPATVDLAAVALEALELALPQYPRADGAEMGAQVFAQPGIAPLSDEDIHPFAGLRDLMGQRKDRNDPEN